VIVVCAPGGCRGGRVFDLANAHDLKLAYVVTAFSTATRASDWAKQSSATCRSRSPSQFLHWMAAASYTARRR
jgi:hypothetical protein